MNTSRFPVKIITTMAMNTTIERYWSGFLSTFATFGRYCPQRIPSTRGIPMMMKMLWKMSPSGITSSGSSPM